MASDTENLQSRLHSIEQQFSDVEHAYEALQSSFAQMQTVYEFAFALSTFFEFDDVLTFTKDRFRDSFDLDGMRLTLVDEAGGLMLAKAFGLLQKGLPATTIQHMKSSLATRKTVRMDEVRVAHRLASLLCVPLVARDGRKIGVMALCRKGRCSFAIEEQATFEKIAGLLAVVTDKIQTYERARTLSFQDELTGAYNRRYFNLAFEREWDRCQRYARPLAIIMLDVDFFKSFNDNHGHVEGDKALRQVAALLTKIMRKPDIVARYGGEEFVILLPETSKEQAKKAATKLCKRVERERFDHEETQPGGKLTISVGLAAFPQDATAQQTLVELADSALYSAKSDGRNCISWIGKTQTSSSEGKPKSVTEQADEPST